MNSEEIKRKRQGERLRRARIDAGYRSAREAALSNHWAESTYRTHEMGTRTIGQDDAEKYARIFGGRGANVDAKSLLFGDAERMASTGYAPAPVYTRPKAQPANKSLAIEGERIEDVKLIPVEIAAWFTAKAKHLDSPELWAINTDALSNARILPGDYVIVETNVRDHAPEALACVLAMHEGKPIFRAIVPPWLLSASPEVPPLPVSSATVAGILIAFLPRQLTSHNPTG